MKKKSIEKILKWLKSMENEEYHFPKTKEELLVLNELHLCCFCRRVPKEISQLKNIKKLVINIGGLKGPLPKEIKYFKHLEELNLGITFLEKLHVNLYKLKKLKKLNLAGNFFNNIPKGISRLKNLEELDLSLYLRELPKDIIQLKKMNKLTIYSTENFTHIQNEWAKNIKVRTNERKEN
jgi:Leucine-rich repeat (LRR) protein